MVKYYVRVFFKRQVSALAAFFSSVWDSILMFFRSYHPITDTLDILIVAVAVYGIIKLVRDSRAEQLLKGFLLLGIAYGAAYLFGLTTTKYLLQVLMDNILIILAIIFQPELRRALERMGHSSFSRFRIQGASSAESREFIERWQRAIASIATATEALKSQRMGALIVIERNTRLGDIAATGTELNADITAELLGNVFFNKAPLHDGAAIVRDARIYAAGCILPLTHDESLNRSLGTRHRAALGMSENSDAVIVVVSEETGVVSVANGGKLKRNFTAESLTAYLEKEIIWSNVLTDEQLEQRKFTNVVRRWFKK